MSGLSHSRSTSLYLEKRQVSLHAVVECTELRYLNKTFSLYDRGKSEFVLAFSACFNDCMNHFVSSGMMRCTTSMFDSILF